MVLGYVSRDVALPDPTRDSIVGWGEPGLTAEFARHKAWLTRAKLDFLIRRMDINASASDIRRMLEDSIADTQRAIEIIKTSSER